MDTTVAIPLHRSLSWLDVIEGNLRRVAGSAHIVVSDASGHDDALAILRERCADLPGIEWRERPVGGGWVGHCNALLAEATTAYFTWLPHDDDIDANWILSAERALGADPAIVLALGEVDGLMPDGLRRLPLEPELTHPDPARRLAAVAHILSDGDTSSLGVAFRGVFRRGVAPALPVVDALGSWADLLWAGELAARGRFATVGGRYLKRYHAENTHAAWASFRDDPRLRLEQLPELLARLDPETAQRILSVTWDREHQRIAAENLALRRELELAQQRYLALERGFRTSTSWRLTAPLRAVSGRRQRHASDDSPSS